MRTGWLAARQTGPAVTAADLRVQILHVPGCPLLGQARAAVDSALRRSGLRAVVEEIAGPYLSPSVLVNGNDVTGQDPTKAAACRLDPPSEAQVLAALYNAHSLRCACFDAGAVGRVRRPWRHPVRGSAGTTE